MPFMADSKASEELASLNTARFRLKSRQIEKVFTDCAMDLKRILVLDGIENFLEAYHDLHDKTVG